VPKPVLNDNFIKALTARNGKRVEIFDHKVSGLVLRVSGQGRKTWVLRYRTENGRQPRFTIGTYPALKLADARDEALKLLAQTKTGDDPASERRRARQAVKTAPIRTFGDLFDAYIDASKKGHWKPRKKQKRERTIRDEEAVYRRYIKAKLGNTFIEDIHRSTVKKLLRDLMDTGIKAQTIQVQAIIRQTFAFGIAEYEDLIPINPAIGFGVIGTTKPRTRTLTDNELREFWIAVLDPPKFRAPNKRGKILPLYLSRSMGIALQLCTLLLVRENEIAGMRLDELNFDTKTWLISGDRMKAGVPHLVPLTDEAIELIKEAIGLRPSPTLDCVFPSPRWHLENKGILPNSIYHAMVDILGAIKLKHATPHDLRRTGSTALTSERIGVLPFIRSKVLGHTTDTGGGAAVSMKHYDANEYVADKRIALSKWQALLFRIVGDAPVSPRAADSKVEMPEAKDGHAVLLHRGQIAA
jgi:integrase